MESTMSKTYLKTYFYVDHEIQFLVTNLEESYKHIDKFIICEFNRTHTGRPREFLGWDYLKDKLPQDKLDKVMYLPMDLSNATKEAYNNEDLIHSLNEPVMRSAFMKVVPLSDDDIVVSVDADEIIYEHMYPKIRKFVEKNGACQLNLHQFFYKKTYFWRDKDFIAPTAIKYRHFKNRFPCNLRYEGVLFPEKAGCHFSWCMTPKEMVYKLHTYSHPRYRFLADEKVLTEVINNKQYPFDKNTSFDIEEISENDIRIPQSMRGKK
jgi:hypothetical protein